MHPGTLGVNYKVKRESKINKTLPKSKKVWFFRVSSCAPYDSREGKFILYVRLLQTLLSPNNFYDLSVFDKAVFVTLKGLQTHLL